MRVLNRILAWTKDGVSFEAGPRHAEIAINEFDPNGAKGVVAPGTEEEGTISANPRAYSFGTRGFGRDASSLYASLCMD